MKRTREQLDLLAQRRKKNYQDKRAAGLCTDCRNVAIPSESRCGWCKEQVALRFKNKPLEKRRKSNYWGTILGNKKKLRETRIAAGLCYQCATPVTKFRLCFECRKTRSMNRKKAKTVPKNGYVVAPQIL